MDTGLGPVASLVKGARLLLLVTEEIVVIEHDEELNGRAEKKKRCKRESLVT